MRLAQESGVNHFLMSTSNRIVKMQDAALSYGVLAYFEDSAHIMCGGQGKMCHFVPKLF